MGHLLLLISLNRANAAWIGVAVVSSLSTETCLSADFILLVVCKDPLATNAHLTLSINRKLVIMNLQLWTGGPWTIILIRRRQSRWSNGEKGRTKRREVDDEKSKTYYHNHKKEILRKQKDKRLQHGAKPTESSASQVSNDVDDTVSFFPSRMAKKQAVDKAKNALPNSPRKRTGVLAELLDSPNTHKSLSESATINSSEHKGEVRLAKALISDLSCVLEATKHKRSHGARATMCVGLSMLCGSTVA